jgi:NAD(P)-dependent dehydrogenase (short-subunit alcohol dehydrogenase family)
MSTGLGYEVAKQLLLKGHEVMLACRDTHKAEQATQQLRSLQQQQQQQGASVSFVQCDLSSFSSVRRCAADVASRWSKFDVLVCNAAVIPKRVTMTDDGFEQQIQVSHLSHFLLVNLLLPCLVKAADTQAVAAAADTGEGTLQQQQQQTQQQDAASSRVVVVGSGLHSRVSPEFADPGKLKELMSGDVTLPPMQM